jgi:[amino group carrier protein]-lysine/ornithine hydrolase
MVDRDAAIELLTSLVAIPSPPRHEALAVEHFVRWMATRGFTAAADAAGNAVGTRGDGPREILLLGHIDTFPGTLPLRHDDDRFYGRGTVDAKGPLCAFAAAAAAVTVPSEWRITVVGAVEEESWTSRGARHLVATWGQRRVPMAVIVGEPSRWDRVTLGYRGSVELRLTLRAPFAHSAGRERLPAERAVDLWHAIEQFCDERNRDRPAREFDRYSATLRSIRTRDDGAFGIATLTIGLRLPLGARLSVLRKGLRAGLDATVSEWHAEGASLSCRFGGGQEAFKAEKTTPLVAAFLRSIRAEGGEPRFVLKTGTADLTIVGPAWPNAMMAVFGPGDSTLDHTPDEHIYFAEYVRAIRVVARVLETLMAR